MASLLLAIAVCVVLLSGCERQQSTTQPRNGVEKIDEREAAADSLATERDLEALQGTWELVSLKRDWVEANEGPCLYEFEGATMTVYPSDMRPSFYTLELNASESPKEMDIIATWEDGSVTKAEVIYDLDGDTFQWCHVDGKRPPAFLSARNRAGTLNVLQRVKAKE